MTLARLRARTGGCAEEEEEQEQEQEEQEKLEEEEEKAEKEQEERQCLKIAMGIMPIMIPSFS